MYFVYCLGILGPAKSDYNMRLILLSVIQLSGGHCISKQQKHLLIDSKAQQSFPYEKPYLGNLIGHYYLCIIINISNKIITIS